MISRLGHGLASRLRTFVLRLRGVRIEGRCWLRAVEIPRHPRGIRLADGVALDRGVTLLATRDGAQIEIGRRTYVNRQTMIDADELVAIGDEVMIGPFCYITDHDHTFGEGVAPSAGALVSKPTRIEARCWLGAHVTILKGVTIGAGTVVGAGSVVTKSLPAGVVAVGNPARVLRPVAS
jgi:acetyltransferase-like isoleucine patch superfamily enzyme